MRSETIRQLWAEARAIDPTLKVAPHQWDALARRQLRPVPFSRELLFSSMARGVPVIFDDLAVPIRRETTIGVREAVLRALREGFPRGEKVRIRCGASGTQRHVTLEELLRRWERGKGRVSVTDMHIRGTKVMRKVDCSRLSDFNILAGAPGLVGDEEMLTMVVSSAGSFSDSHTDDPDGSNHCFIGRKLWLVWDTFLGLAHGLEDVERCTVKTRAAFSVAGFLSVPKARWFLVESGRTLFLPGHLTHKVITLENYIGVGSFFVMLPSFPRTLERWTRHTPLWALDAPDERRLDLVDRITKRVAQRVRDLTDASDQERARWGIEQLCSAAREWHELAPDKTRAELYRRPVSAELLECIKDFEFAARNNRIERRQAA
jgi:hypothetical protein